MYDGYAMKTILVAQKIREYRQQHGLTQEEFGRLLGVSAQAISKWERVACYPDITFLPDIAALLGCSIDDFFAATDGSRDILYPS